MENRKKQKKEEKIGGPHPYARGCHAPGEGATDRVLAFCVVCAHVSYGASPAVCCLLIYSISVSEYKEFLWRDVTLSEIMNLSTHRYFRLEECDLFIAI